MSKNKTINTLLQIKEVVAALAALALWILALWFSSKLAPYVQRMDSFDNRVSAVEKDVEDVNDSIDDLETVSNNTNKDVIKIKCYLIPEECLD